MPNRRSIKKSVKRSKKSVKRSKKSVKRSKKSVKRSKKSIKKSVKKSKRSKKKNIRRLKGGQDDWLYNIPRIIKDKISKKFGEPCKQNIWHCSEKLECKGNKFISGVCVPIDGLGEYLKSHHKEFVEKIDITSLKGYVEYLDNNGKFLNLPVKQSRDNKLFK